MERAKRKTTTTTATMRRTRNSSTTPDSVQDSTIKPGRIKAVRAAAAGKTNSVVNDQLRKRKTENSDMKLSTANAGALLNQSCDSDSTDAASNCSSDQKRLHQINSRIKVKIAGENPSCLQSSPIKVLKKSRSEPFEGGGESTESELLRKVKSDNWNFSSRIDEVTQLNGLDGNDDEQVDDPEDESMTTEDLSVDTYEEIDDDEMVAEIEMKVEDEVAEIAKNGCEEETEVVSLEENEVVVDNKSIDQVDRVNEGEGEDEGEQRMDVDNDVKDLDQTRDNDVGGSGSGGGCGCGGDDEVVELKKNKSKRVLLRPVIAKSNLIKSRVEGEGGGDGEHNTNFDNSDKKDADQTHDVSGGGGGGSDDELVKLKNRTKRVLSPPSAKSNLGLSKSSLVTKSTPSTPPTTTTSVSHERPTSRSIHNPTLKSHIPPTTARDVSKQYDDDGYTIPETHSKLQSLVDLVLWKDVSKTAFIFGFGTFIIISSSYAKDFNFSFISFTSYTSLVYLAVVFLYKSFINREMMDKEAWPEKYVWGEEEAMWLVKLVLPYMNEFLLKLRGIFSGDPAMTMKLAVVLFVLARCGSSITLWKTVKLGFFGVFVVPKLCSSYSPQITAYGNFWVGRFRDAWESCSHKKALAFGIFTLVWNFSSVVARAWAAFMLFVALRYYQQSMITQDFSEEQTESSHNNVHLRHVARNRGRVPTSLDQRKLKKSF